MSNGRTARTEVAATTSIIMLRAADIISTLPDQLLGLVLSKIPIRQAVRCSILSKKWRLLYTQMPHLTLSPFRILGRFNEDPDPLSVAMLENIISNLLVLHSTDLESFHLSNHMSPWSFRRGDGINKEWQFSRQSVWKWATNISNAIGPLMRWQIHCPPLWVRYAACRNIQHLTLCTSAEMEEVPPELFSCTDLTDIKLLNSILTRIPAHFPGFNHLVTCLFHRIEFTDESFFYFSHCPFLERLEILESVGLRKPIISAPNLTYLVIRARNEIEVLIVDCPKLTTLWACKIRDLRVNGVLFQEFSYAVRSLKMQSGSNVIVLQLEEEFEEEDLSAQRFLEFVGAFKALVELCIPKCLLVQTENEMVVFMIHTLLDTLPYLERLEMPGVYFSGMVRDPLTSCPSSTLAHLRIIKVGIVECGE